MAHQSLDWNNWLYGLWVSVVSGISDGVIVGVGLNLTDPADWNAKQNRLYNLIIPIIIIMGTKAFFLYLKQNPAPKQITVESAKKTTMPSGATIEEATKTTATIPEKESVP